MRHTESPGGDVGGDQYGGGVVAELVQHIVAVLLVLVPVDGEGTPAGTVYRLTYVVDLQIMLWGHSPYNVTT